MTGDVRKKDSLDIVCSLVGQDEECRDFTECNTKSLEGFGKGNNRT